jgi:hypothetical protein
MAAYTIQSMATLGAYAQADLVPSGLLAKAHKQAKEKAQADACAKVAKAKMQAAVVEAEALAVEEEKADELDGESCNDGDMLELSSRHDSEDSSEDDSISGSDGSDED